MHPGDRSSILLRSTICSLKIKTLLEKGIVVSLEVLYRRGNVSRSVTLDWAPRLSTLELFIAIDPPTMPSDWIVDGTTNFFARWRQHQFFFRVPRCRHPEKSVCLVPVRQWQSKSNNSDARYPWWWNLGDCDIILQILPGPGRTSSHFHRVTKFEDYVPLDNLDRGTKIVLGDKKPVALVEPISVAAGCRHYLVRDAPGFSVQLLRMRGPVRFPDRSDHVC